MACLPKWLLAVVLVAAAAPPLSAQAGEADKPATAATVTAAAATVTAAATSTASVAEPAPSPSRSDADFQKRYKAFLTDRQHLGEAEQELRALRGILAAAAHKAEQHEQESPAQPGAPGVQSSPRAPTPGKVVQVSLDLKETGSLMDLASSLYELGKFDQALQCYDKIKPDGLALEDKAWLAFQKGNAHFFLGDYTKCASHMAGVVNNHPETQWAKRAAEVMRDIRFWKRRDDIIKTCTESEPALPSPAVEPE